MEREMFTPPPEQDPGAPALGEEPRRPWNEEDDVLAKADCHDACVPLAEEIRRLESLCEVKRLELKDLREELAEAQAAHMAKTLSLKADQRILPLFDQRPAYDVEPDEPPEPGQADGEPVVLRSGFRPDPVQEPADEPDWWDTPLEQIFDCKTPDVDRAVALLRGCDVRTAQHFFERRVNYPGTWHRGIGKVGGKGIGSKTAKAMDTEFDAWVARHEKEGGTDA